MPDGFIIGLCLKSVVDGCDIKAIKLDDDDKEGLPDQLPQELKSKFGSLCRCDFYLLAQEGGVLVLIEETDLPCSIEDVRQKFSRNLKQILGKKIKFDVTKAYGKNKKSRFLWDAIFSTIHTEHRDKAMATLYILEYFRQWKVDSNLRSILDYEKVAYVLLLPNTVKDAVIQQKIIAKIRNSLQGVFIDKEDFHDVRKINFCRHMLRKRLHDRALPTSND